jgi:hypothetical protein
MNLSAQQSLEVLGMRIKGGGRGIRQGSIYCPNYKHYLWCQGKSQTYIFLNIDIQQESFICSSKRNIRCHSKINYSVYNDTEECSCDLPSPSRNCMTHYQVLAEVATKIIHTL